MGRIVSKSYLKSTFIIFTLLLAYKFLNCSIKIHQIKGYIFIISLIIQLTNFYLC